MSKERLEKAKKILNHIKGYGVYDGNDDIEIFEWLIEQLEKTRELYKTDVKYYIEDSRDAKFAIDMLESENKRYRQTIDFLKLKLVDFERHTETIRRLTDNELIKIEAERLRDDVLDTLKAVEQEKLKKLSVQFD